MKREFNENKRTNERTTRNSEPSTHFVHRLKSVSIKRSLLKQADLRSCGLWVEGCGFGRKFLTHNSQHATLNPISRLLACFGFVDAHLGWMVKDVCHSQFTTRHSLLAIRSSLLTTRYSPFAAVFGSAGASPSHSPCPVSIVPCPLSHANHFVERRRSAFSLMPNSV